MHSKSLKTLRFITIICLYIPVLCFHTILSAQNQPKIRESFKSRYKVIAFYTAQKDEGHISYVHEANKFFARLAAAHNFGYDSTNNWTNLNSDFLKGYQVVLFLDTRPEVPAQREAFRMYMEQGGSWIGFHFAGFALTPSAYNQDWDWYHNVFLGSGCYKSNTWRPVSAILKIEDRGHPAVKNLGPMLKSSPNEWYRWENDLRLNPDIDILMSIDPSSFPLGTGPELSEIWHNGYYPVVWTNRKFRMIYVNMGHNDIDYEHNTYKTLSQTFANKAYDEFMLNALNWLGAGKKSDYIK